MGVKHLSRYAVGYILWAVSIFISGIIGLVVRESVMDALVINASRNMGADNHADFYLGFQLRAVEPWTYMLYGLLMIVVVVFLENYFRGGVRQGRLLQRFLIVTGIEAGVLALAHGTRFAANIAIGGVSSTVLVLAVVELVAAALLILFSRRLSTRTTAFEHHLFDD